MSHSESGGWNFRYRNSSGRIVPKRYCTCLCSLLTHFVTFPVINLSSVSAKTILDSVRHNPSFFVLSFLLKCYNVLLTGDWFTSRTSACGLFAVAYSRLGTNTKSDLRS